MSGSSRYGDEREFGKAFFEPIRFCFLQDIREDSCRLQKNVCVLRLPLLVGLSTPLSGNYNNSSANNQGSWGNWWSSTYNNGNNMYNLNVNPTNVNPNNNNNRNNGNTMRCLVGE